MNNQPPGIPNPEPTIPEGLTITTDPDAQLDSITKRKIIEQSSELTALGCPPVGVHVPGGDAPLRFFINFEPNKPSFGTRANLEKHRYDVGQHMGDKMLRFYASKRSAKGEGWG